MMVARTRSKLSSMPNQPRRRKVPFSSRTRLLTLRTLENSEPPGDVHLILTTQLANKEKAMLTTCISHRSHQRLLLDLNDKRTGNCPRAFRPSSVVAALSRLTALHSGFSKEALQASPFYSITSALRNGIFQLCSHESPLSHKPNLFFLILVMLRNTPITLHQRHPLSTAHGREPQELTAGDHKAGEHWEL